MEGKHFGSWVHEVEASNPIGNGYTLGARLKSQLNLNVELESVGTARILVGECSGPDSCQHAPIQQKTGHAENAGENAAREPER